MFTGIVEKTARIQTVANGASFRRLTLESHWNDITLGESIAINGCCLTVAEMNPNSIVFDVIQETLNKTNLGLLTQGDEVNVERSLRLSDRLSGHFVQGHIDGTALLTHVASGTDESRLTLTPPTELVKYLIPKGSVTLDGVSLTIAALHKAQFEVALIPTTLSLTTLAEKNIGWPFNLETDILSKTIISHLERQGPHTT